MLLVREDVIGETLDPPIAKLSHTNAAAEGFRSDF